MRCDIRDMILWHLMYDIWNIWWYVIFDVQSHMILFETVHNQYNCPVRWQQKEQKTWFLPKQTITNKTEQPLIIDFQVRAVSFSRVYCVRMIVQLGKDFGIIMFRWSGCLYFWSSHEDISNVWKCLKWICVEFSNHIWQYYHWPRICMDNFVIRMYRKYDEFSPLQVLTP